MRAGNRNLSGVSDHFFMKGDALMAQASVLTDHEIRKVFRIIETTRQAERNRIAFMLSIYAGLRVGEIAALTIGDVVAHDRRAIVAVPAPPISGVKLGRYRCDSCHGNSPI
jgi:integrase